LVKEENGNLLADSHNMVSEVRQTEIHTAEPGPFEVEIDIAKLKKYCDVHAVGNMAFVYNSC
jgi:hypothetical protein